MEVWLMMAVAQRSNLPDHCEPTTPFLRSLSTHLNVCVPTPFALISTVFGTLSICAWLCAQTPQIYKNYKLKSASGLSIYFLIEWAFADSTNLLGAIFLHQATWQVVLASYYCAVDTTLLIQYIWYTYFQPQQLIVMDCEDMERSDPDIMREVTLVGSSSPTSTRAPLLSRKSTTFSIPNYSAPPSPVAERTSNPTDRSVSPRRRPGPPSPVASPKTFLFAATILALASHTSLAQAASLSVPTTTPQSVIATEAASRVLAWTSAVLYLGSRVPQLWKNHRRRSTAGLSPLLFIAAFCGNLFYSASLATNPLAWESFGPYGGGGWAGPSGSDRSEWTLNTTPFFLGAAGVLFMDAAMGVQFCVFGEGGGGTARGKLVRDESGRWYSVKGWMRGWMPSPKQNALGEGEHTGLLAREDQDRYGTL